MRMHYVEWNFVQNDVKLKLFGGKKLKFLEVLAFLFFPGYVSDVLGQGRKLLDNFCDFPQKILLNTI